MARRKAFTKKRRELFLDVFRDTGNVTKAAEAIGMNRQYMYELRAESESFAKAWADAEADYLEDVCVDELRRRAYDGIKRIKEKRKIEIDADGNEKTIEITREASTYHSDRLLEFHLRSRHPDYKKTSNVNLSTEEGKPLQIEDATGWDLSNLTYEELVNLRELQARARPSSLPAPESADGDK